ncbi:MAG: MoaD/ThiS family protein [Gammaproteobacteria bacterium]|uniref:MoaD/ThiS family protein n=1 Tax=Marinomonas sp. ef1 TaxID=2005043 RepID=UPI000C284CE3|nr:MoaD/ThiS family protein [Marinomonas sp. ef1]MBU1293434.1 MoaD/ThiS family protein [Gammaproteobacteria bacterium]MBU1467201.1 MoaD/ThiS family protein [Gammaproteobacteria bacterium]MBU2021936.1 MoaD/ThiS family protein [Gammaproteobacteria bacterium]MBU2239771.1 MoaD/ThiS family protein [Gammaproteobacteria bacterium]MBU2319270.1 MoaD/ThiS family protein [Gammaproteobacteria bacterium]
MSKVRVVFFASLKESIGQSEYIAELALPLSISELKHQLANELDKGQALLEKGIQSSIDFEFARGADIVPESVSEVAFFPPVTGG